MSKSLLSKSIPVLDLVALHFGVECMKNLYDTLAGAIHPIKIGNLLVYTDSTISSNWLRVKFVDCGKIKKKVCFH